MGAPSAALRQTGLPFIHGAPGAEGGERVGRRLKRNTEEIPSVQPAAWEPQFHLKKDFPKYGKRGFTFSFKNLKTAYMPTCFWLNTLYIRVLWVFEPT